MANTWCWRCNGKRIIEDKKGTSGRRWWVCPVCDPNLPADTFTSRRKVNPVPPTEPEGGLDSQPAGVVDSRSSPPRPGSAIPAKER